MPNLADVFADDVTAHSIDLMRLDAHTRREVLGILFELQESLVQEITSISPTDPVRQTIRFRRMEVLNDNVARIIREHYQQINSLTNSSMRDLAGFELERSSAMFNEAIGINLMTVDTAPTVLTQIVRGTLIEGAPQKEWWGRQAESLRQNFTDQMTQGIIRGETNSQLVQRVRGTHTGTFQNVIVNGTTRRVGNFAGGIMDISTSKASTLVRTSVQSVANYARLESYQQNSELIKGMQALVTLDNRTSTICIARSNKAWTLDGDPIPPNTESFPGPPPWHFNCRSTLIPLTYSWDELAARNSGLSRTQRTKLFEIDDGTQASMDGYVAEDLSYEQWLGTKPVSFQKEVLGTSRWTLWNEGKISSLSQLVDQSGNPLSMAELQAKYS